MGEPGWKIVIGRAAKAALEGQTFPMPFFFRSLKMRSCLIAQPSAVSVVRDVPGHRGDLPG